MDVLKEGRRRRRTAQRPPATKGLSTGCLGGTVRAGYESSVIDDTQFSDVQAARNKAAIAYQGNRVAVESEVAAAVEKKRNKELTDEEEDALVNGLDDPAKFAEIRAEIGEETVIAVLDRRIDWTYESALQASGSRAAGWSLS